MKSSKSNNLPKIVGFVLIAILLICTIGFAVNGWQAEDLPDSGENGDQTNNTDENQDGNNQINNSNNDNSQIQNGTTENAPPQDSVDSPIFYNKMTGLRVSEEQFLSFPIAYVTDPASPIYGLSRSDIVIEFPTETNSTRLLSFTTDQNLLWKIGTLAPTRDYISSILNFFGGVLVSFGNDDKYDYGVWDFSGTTVDISKNNKCYFSENSFDIYTTKEMTDSAINNTPNITKEGYGVAPYIISKNQNKNATIKANHVTLPFFEGSETKLIYSESSSEYSYYKNGESKIDMLSGKQLSYKNVFILFADATTYEKSEGTELVIDTYAGGAGYFISGGKLTEIRWKVNENEELVFSTLDGKMLEVNPGNAYMAFFKTASKNAVIIK